MPKASLSSTYFTWKGVLNALANLSALLLFSAFVFSSCRHFLKTGSVLSFGLVTVNTIFLILFLTRREAKTVSHFPFAWVLGFTGTLLPMLLRPSDLVLPANVSSIGNALQIVGAGMIMIALMSLRRSFGIVAANRGIQEGGLYRLVRHPLYASELLFLLGFTLSHPTIWNISIWLLEVGIQYSRARIEEHLLQEDSVYQNYLERTRYRFFPGLL